jgi:hypothetical protein
MISKNWMKWTAGTAAALMALVTVPAIGQARVYTGKVPASITPSHLSARHTVKLASRKKKHKAKKHKKTNFKATHASRSTKTKA